MLHEKFSAGELCNLKQDDACDYLPVTHLKESGFCYIGYLDNKVLKYVNF